MDWIAFPTHPNPHVEALTPSVMEVPPACLVKMELGFRMQPGRLTAACGSELAAALKAVQDNNMFLCAHHISLGYVMSVFHLHSSVLNFHCEGSVTDAFHLLPCNCKIYHSKLLILFMSGKRGEPHRAGRGTNLWNHWKATSAFSSLPFILSAISSSLSFLQLLFFFLI